MAVRSDIPPVAALFDGVFGDSAIAPCLVRFFKNCFLAVRAIDSQRFPGVRRAK